MQALPPESGGFDWAHAASAFGGAIVGVIASLFGWIYRAGGKEPKIRADLEKAIITAEQRLETKIEEAEKRGEQRIDDLVDRFQESFTALRQKINDVEKNNVSKDEFNEFRKEHREDFQQLRQENRQDFADLKRNVAEILGKGNGKQ